MATLKWCKRQKQGIRFVEPNENLAKEYLGTAEETLDVLRLIKGRSKVWGAVTRYYCEYFAVYAVLMRLGIRCEIHDCTITISGRLERLGLLPKGTQAMLRKDKDLRIENQYYLKNRDVPEATADLLGLVLQIKEILHRCDDLKAANVRKELMR